MSTQAQIAANRANSALSTGPRSAEGKTASSANATTHGAAATRISPHDAEGLARRNALRAQYTGHYKPAGPIETELILDMATSRVRMEKVEAAILDYELRGGDPTSRPMELLHRYLREARRAWDRARATLESGRSQATRQTIAVANTTARMIKAELKVAEPLKSELASFRQRLEAAFEQSSNPVPVQTPQPTPAPSNHRQPEVNPA